MIILGGFPDGVVFGPHGITPAQIGTAGNATSPLANDIDPGDETTEFLFQLVLPLPSSGTTIVNDAAGYGLVGAAAGIYAQGYRVLFLPATGAPGSYTSTITTTVGVLAPVIVTQPQSIAVDEGAAAAFSIAHTGGTSFQWMRNGEDIDGATGTTYTLGAALLTDNGAQFSVMVSNSAGFVISSPATLTVNIVGGTLIVEDGTAKPNADSYISTSDANAYHAARGRTAWAALTTLQKEAALRQATDYMLQMYRWRWAGVRRTDTQALDWPRANVPRLDSGALLAYYPDGIVPVEVQRACAELALRAAEGDLAPDVGRLVSRERVDVIEIEYADGAPPWVRYRAVDNMLAALFKPSGGSTITLSRG